MVIFDNKMFKHWHDLALYLYSCFDLPLSIKEITDVINRRFESDISYNTVKSYIYRVMKHNKEIIQSSDNSQIALPGFGVQPDDEATPVKPEKKNNVVFENQDPKVSDVDWDGSTKILFGLMGDTQMGSKYTQITHLRSFYDECKKRGVKTVYHTGDITDGIKMRPGHEYELYAISADEMKDDVVKNYPHIDGIETYFITGNHDASLYKHVGYDIGRAIAAERPDMHYLGRDCAVVKLTPDCTLELRHPWDGTAYAMSYKIQKMIEAMESDSKPNILAVGHYHKAEYLFYRNIHAFQTGCFQGQTPFTRGKGISVHMGGWIIEVTVDEWGTIKSISPTFIPFYSAIGNDYKQY